MKQMKTKIFNFMGTDIVLTKNKKLKPKRVPRLGLSNRQVCLIYNPRVSKGRLVLDYPEMSQIYIIEPDRKDTGTKRINLEKRKSIQVVIEQEEMRMRGFFR